MAIDCDPRFVGHIEARHQRDHQVGDPDRKEKTKQTAQNRNEHTFGEQLAHELTSSSPDRKADGHFPRSRSRSGELEIRNIEASDQQKKSDRSKK